MKIPFKYFEAIEKRTWLLGILTAAFLSLGGLAEITPLFAAANSVKAPEGVKPYSAERLAGFEVYVHSGCYLCHSQMIRHLSFETERYGPVSVAEESVFDRPMQWGSKRTGPDLARIGGKYSDAWQRQHLIDPRSVVHESNMPKYGWLEDKTVNAKTLQNRMRAMRKLGTPYTDEEIEAAFTDVEGKSQMDVLIAYLQGLGIDNKAPANETQDKEVDHL